MKVKYFISGYLVFMLCCFTGQSSSSSCHPEKLPCDDGSCVDRDKWCDFEDDCPDKSDEKYCDMRGYIFSDPNNCEATHFLCKNGRCIPSVAACDGIRDCSDGSDEKKCDERRIYHAPPPVTEEEPAPTSPYRRTAPQPTAEERETSDTSHRRRDPDQRQTSEVGRSYPDQPPDRQAVQHRDSSRPVIQAPRPIIRRPSPVVIHVLPTRESLRKAQEWLLRERSVAFGWGRDTSRALVALSLSENGRFFREQRDTARMKKHLQVQLAVDLIRNNTKVISLSRLSLYINALLASCQNPRNFHGRDLADELRKRTTSLENQRNRENHVFINPVTYLTLCLVDETSEADIYNLREFLHPKTNEQKWRDMQAISIMAYSCISKISRFTSTCQTLLEEATNDLIGRMEEYGNFGNVYSTALAVQALISAGATNRWNSEMSINYLKSHQKPDGSFGDLLATYYVMPVLAGKGLAHLKHVTCDRTETAGLSIESLRNYKGPLHYVRYSLYFGDPVQVTNSKTLLVPVDSNFFDIMTLAAEMDLKFRFLHELEGDAITVYSISNVPNDAERRIFWQLYVNPNNQVVNENGLPISTSQPYNGGVQNLIPKAGDHVVFWYRPETK